MKCQHHCLEGRARREGKVDELVVVRWVVEDRGVETKNPTELTTETLVAPAMQQAKDLVDNLWVASSSNSSRSYHSSSESCLVTTRKKLGQ